MVAVKNCNKVINIYFNSGLDSEIINTVISLKILRTTDLNYWKKIFDTMYEIRKNLMSNYAYTTWSNVHFMGLG